MHKEGNHTVESAVEARGGFSEGPFSSFWWPVSLSPWWRWRSHTPDFSQPHSQGCCAAAA
jgi:hypothetical protein